MSEARYRIDKDFDPGDPKPADFFCHFDPAPVSDLRRSMDEVFNRWRVEGVQSVRVTQTGPDVEGDDSGYPAGVWLEGWKERHARQLQFGGEYDGVIWPPLTYRDSDAHRMAETEGLGAKPE